MICFQDLNPYKMHFAEINVSELSSVTEICTVLEGNLNPELSFTTMYFSL